MFEIHLGFRHVPLTGTWPKKSLAAIPFGKGLKASAIKNAILVIAF